MSVERGESIVEFAAIRPPADEYDVAILGGGLAGLTLAIQLKQMRPETSVVVLEKREGPAPLAAFKVGESTVPSGAHYFSEVVGMHDHLHAEQLIKCGLRYFPPANGNEDITKRVEAGPPLYPPHDNFQLDRGLFENKLAARARALGVDLQQGARVREIDLDADPHRVTFEQFEQEATLSARWIVDAAGRASILKRKLDLMADCGHHINSAWLRLGGGLDLESWGADDAEWMARMSKPGIRQFSTNHLMGEGYWVWMIPLSTGPISIGVCADPRFHPYEEINELERLLGWMRKHEPQLAASIEERPQDIEDFLRVKDFAYGVKQMFSTDRWALVGEAGAFADPFYSPGSDFIGYSNTFTADLVTRDLNGEQIGERADYYNDLYQRLFAHVISRYRDSYPVFGNAWVMCGLLTWDFYSNHTGSVLAVHAEQVHRHRLHEARRRVPGSPVQAEHQHAQAVSRMARARAQAARPGHARDLPGAARRARRPRQGVPRRGGAAGGVARQRAQLGGDGGRDLQPGRAGAAGGPPGRSADQPVRAEPRSHAVGGRRAVRGARYDDRAGARDGDGDRRYVGLLARVCGWPTSGRRRTARRCGGPPPGVGGPPA